MKSRYFAAALAACALTASGAWAQTAAPVNTRPMPPMNSSATPPVNTSATSPANTSATPLPGSNSFTEGEARNRIEARGFGSVTGLQKDDQGIWRGTATQNGKSTQVALDFKGNVFAK